MRIEDRDQLLNQVLGGDDLEPLRRATFEGGLASLRRRRRRRRLAQVSAVACLVVFAGLVTVFRLDLPVPTSGNTTHLAHASISAPGGPPALKIITDEELFALFPGRPMALVGKPGHQQLVFLDQRKPTETALTR
jgi:hypothetical protein